MRGALQAWGAQLPGTRQAHLAALLGFSSRIWWGCPEPAPTPRKGPAGPGISPQCAPPQPPLERRGSKPHPSRQEGYAHPPCGLSAMCSLPETGVTVTVSRRSLQLCRPPSTPRASPPLRWARRCPGTQGAGTHPLTPKEGATGQPYLVGRILAATWAGAGLPSRWRRWARPGSPTGWPLAVRAPGSCCPGARPV